MGNKAITAIQQYNILRHEFPESSGSVRCGTMTWFGEFMPSALSDTYRLKITYTTLSSTYKCNFLGADNKQ